MEAGESRSELVDTGATGRGLRASTFECGSSDSAVEVAPASLVASRRGVWSPGVEEEIVADVANVRSGQLHVRRDARGRGTAHVGP